MSPKILNKTEQQAREDVILDCALNLIKKEGTALLTIDKVVRDTPYSKGTIYNHFCGKEDLLLGLCNRSMNGLADMFVRSQTLEGHLREKVLATMFAYMLHARLYPEQLMLAITAKTSNITEKASEVRREQHTQAEGKLIGPTTLVFQQAINSGVIDPPVTMSLEQISFACWSIGFGCITLLSQEVENCGTRAGLLAEQEMLNSANILFDGLRFQPFTRDFDWTKTINKLKNDIFKEEIEILGKRGVVLNV